MYIVSANRNIERIRQLARELNVDMVNRGINCLPQDIIGKYMGSICRVNRAGGCVLYYVRIKHNEFHRSGSPCLCHLMGHSTT